MKYLLVFLLVFLPAQASAQSDLTRYVNPFIGTGGHGHTFPGATVPFGMVQLSPDTRGADWDGSSGYHYSDDVIYGFSHTHLSGTGIPDYCDILFMPIAGNIRFYGSATPNPGEKFSHSNERAEPGYYSVKLDNGIRAEMTATQRVGVHRYQFPSNVKPNLLLDLKWRDAVLDSEFRVVGLNRIEGFRRSRSWAQDQIVYFVAEFSKPFSAWGVFDGSNELRVDKGSSTDGKGLRVLIAGFPANASEITVKVALSPVSIEGARKNLAAEMPGWDFDKVRADAKAAWNKELSKIEVSGGTDAQMKTFYTALYHTMIQPNIFEDVDGNYLGHDGKIHNIKDDNSSAMSSAFTRPNVSPKAPDANAKPPKGGTHNARSVSR